MATPQDTTPLAIGPNSVPLQQTYRTIVSGLKTITTSGTAVQLIIASTVCKRVDVVALYGNAGTVYVGDVNVLASTKQGMPLTQGSSYTAYINDVSAVYVDSTSSADKVSFVYYV